MDAQSEATLDRLISCLRRFSDALARLPPTSKGELSRRVSAILGKPQFDTEVFIELVDAVAATLPSLSPQKRADDVLSIIQPEPGEGKRSPLVDDWEAMPATTRVKVERKIQSNRPMSLARWLGNVADLLARERPVRKRGTPRSIMWVFASRAAAIWRTLGLNPGRAYNFFLYPGTDKKIGHGGRVESCFQRYCHAALAAFGDFRKVSVRQVHNLKKSSMTRTKAPWAYLPRAKSMNCLRFARPIPLIFESYAG